MWHWPVVGPKMTNNLHSDSFFPPQFPFFLFPSLPCSGAWHPFPSRPNKRVHFYCFTLTFMFPTFLVCVHQLLPFQPYLSPITAKPSRLKSVQRVIPCSIPLLSRSFTPPSPLLLSTNAFSVSCNQCELREDEWSRFSSAPPHVSVCHLLFKYNNIITFSFLVCCISHVPFPMFPWVFL